MTHRTAFLLFVLLSLVATATLAQTPPAPTTATTSVEMRGEEHVTLPDEPTSVTERGERHIIPGAPPQTPGLALNDFKVESAAACPPQGDKAFAYHGGKLLINAQIVVVFWGSQWNGASLSARRATLIDRITRVVHSPYLTQLYKDIHCPASLDFLTDADSTPAPGTNVDDAVTRLIRAGRIPDPSTHTDNAILLIAPGSGYADGYFGWHNWEKLTNGAYVHYGVVDQRGLSQVTQTFTHELVETITDPRPSLGGGIYDGNCGQRCENADACYCFVAVQGDIPVTYYFSLTKNACVAPDGTGGCTTPQTPQPGTTGRILFVSTRDGNQEIYVMNPDGSGQTRLTNNAAADYDPAWSPDSTKIVFVSDRDGHAEIYVMNPDGTGQTRITKTTAKNTNPAWGAAAPSH